MEGAQGRDPEGEKFSLSRLLASTMSGPREHGTTETSADVKLPSSKFGNAGLCGGREDRESVGHESCRPRALEELDDTIRAQRNPYKQVVDRPHRDVDVTEKRTQ